MIIRFDVPDETCRRAILKKFARQLGDDEIQRLAARTKGKCVLGQPLVFQAVQVLVNHPLTRYIHYCMLPHSLHAA